MTQPTILDALQTLGAAMSHYNARELSTIISRTAWPDCSRLFVELAGRGFVTSNRTTMVRASDGCRVIDLGSDQVCVVTAFLDKNFSTRQWEEVIAFIFNEPVIKLVIAA